MAGSLCTAKWAWSRSASVAIAWVMQSQGMGFLEAFDSVRAKRPEVLPNIGFASQLQQLEDRLRSGPRSSREVSPLARYLKDICNVPAAVHEVQDALEAHGYDAPAAIEAMFAGEDSAGRTGGAPIGHTLLLGETCVLVRAAASKRCARPHDMHATL